MSLVARSWVPAYRHPDPQHDCLIFNVPPSLSQANEFMRVSIHRVAIRCSSKWPPTMRAARIAAGGCRGPSSSGGGVTRKVSGRPSTSTAKPRGWRRGLVHEVPLPRAPIQVLLCQRIVAKLLRLHSFVYCFLFSYCSRLSFYPV